MSSNRHTHRQTDCQTHKQVLQYLTCTCSVLCNNLSFCKSYLEIHEYNCNCTIIFYSRCFAIHCMSSRSITFLGLGEVGCNQWWLIVEKTVVAMYVIASRSFRTDQELWTVEWSGTWLSLSNWCTKGHRVPSDFPTHTMILSVLLTPGPPMATPCSNAPCTDLLGCLSRETMHVH